MLLGLDHVDIALGVVGGADLLILEQRLYPALLTADDMRGLRAEEGDQGARALLRSLPRNSLVPLMAEEALDIDTPKDLCRDRVPPVVRP